MQKICIIGLGYIGIPTAALSAASGYDVLGVDIDKRIIENLSKGFLKIDEDDLKSIFLDVLNKKKISFSLEVKPSDVFIISVPTPLKISPNSFKKADLSAVYNAAREIKKVIKNGDLVILESTSPVGTTKELAEIILSESENENINKDQVYFAHCPERVLPGNIIDEMINNSRIIGGLRNIDSLKAKTFYESISKGKTFMTNASTAEMVKLSENAYRDVNIAFANELSMIADSHDIDIKELITLANHHPRVEILNPSCGVGGHCIAIDPWFIIQNNYENSKLIKTSREVNKIKEEWCIKKIIRLANSIQKEGIDNLRIGILGITYKKNNNDLRESPSERIALNLKDLGYEIYVCEPNISSHKELKLISLEEMNLLVDIVVTLVDHKEFNNFVFSNKQILNLC